MSIKINLILALFLVLALFFRLNYFFSHQPVYKKGQKIELTAILNSQPQIYPKSQRLEIKGVRIVTQPFPRYHYGDRLSVVGTLEDGVLIFPEIKIIKKGKGNLFLEKIYQLRRRLTTLFEGYLPEPAGALLLGIFLGVKRTLPQDFYWALKKTGVLHVIVASGMNVTMVASFVLAGFGLVFKRRLALFLALMAVFFYSLLSGFDPPIVRAAIMGTILLLGEFFGRLNFRVLSLLLAGYLMLFFDPGLISDLGFQLSFLSTTGLIFIKPLFSLKREDSLYLLKDDFITTLSAQTMTLPILLANFGQYQFLSLLVNTLVLWTTPILMALGGAVAIGGLIFSPLGQILAYLAYPFLIYFQKVITFFGRFSLVEVRTGNWPIFSTLGYYFLLTSILVFCYKRRKQEKM